METAQRLEQRKAALDEYVRAKEVYFDVVHESLRVKDDEFTRAMSFHESHTLHLEAKLASLEEHIRHFQLIIRENIGNNENLTETVNLLNKALFNYVLNLNPGKDPGGEVSTVAPTLRDELTALQGSPSRGNASLATASTLSILKSDNAALRHSIKMIIDRVQGLLEFKTKQAVDELVSDAKKELNVRDDLRSDPHLMRAIEQRRKDLLAITNAQAEIDALKEEREKLTMALRKAEQETVQMRLKVMDRDSNMAVLSKRIKEIDIKFREEQATSAARIEQAELLAGELTKKYEQELRRYRETIDGLHADIRNLNKVVDNERAEVQRVWGVVEATKQQVEEARKDGLATGRAEVTIKLDELKVEHGKVIQQRDNWKEEHEQSEIRCENLRAELATSETLSKERETTCQMLREEMIALRTELAERKQSPFGFLTSRQGSREKQSGNGLLSVTPLVEEVVALSQSGPQGAEQAIRKLSSRLTKVHSWGLSSEKARHPSISAKISSALQDLAAGMLAVASSGLPPPPTPQQEQERSERRMSRSSTRNAAASSSSRSRMSDQVVVLPGGPSKRHSRSKRLGDSTKSCDPMSKPVRDKKSKVERTSLQNGDTSATDEFPPAGENSRGEKCVSDDDLDENDEDSGDDSLFTPSSSDDDGVADIFSPPPMKDAECDCRPQMVERAAQTTESKGTGQASVTPTVSRAGGGKIGKPLRSRAESSESSIPSPSPAHADKHHLERSLNHHENTRQVEEGELLLCSPNLELLESSKRSLLIATFVREITEMQNVVRLRQLEVAIGTLQHELTVRCATVAAEDASLTRLAESHRLDLEKSIVAQRADLGRVRRASLAVADEIFEAAALPSTVATMLTESRVFVEAAPGALARRQSSVTLGRRGSLRVAVTTASQAQKLEPTAEMDAHKERPLAKMEGSMQHDERPTQPPRDSVVEAPAACETRTTSSSSHTRKTSVSFPIEETKLTTAVALQTSMRESDRPVPQLIDQGHQLSTNSQKEERTSSEREHRARETPLVPTSIEATSPSLVAMHSNIMTPQLPSSSVAPTEAAIHGATASTFIQSEEHSVQAERSRHSISSLMEGGGSGEFQQQQQQQRSDDGVEDLVEELAIENDRLKEELSRAASAREAMQTILQTTQTRFQSYLELDQSISAERRLEYSTVLPTRLHDSSVENRGTVSIVRVHDEQETEEYRSLLATVTWFLLEGQRLIPKKLLPQGKPLMPEGRSTQNVSHAQSLFSHLLEAMRSQKDKLVADAERKRKRKGKSSGEALFLDTPDIAALEPTNEAEAVDDDAEDLELEPLEESALAKKLLQSPRKDMRQKEEEQSDSESGGSSDDDSPFVMPLIPRLEIPVNPHLKRLELDAIVQPLLLALRKKLQILGLSTLLSAEDRSGTAVELESALDNLAVPTTILHSNDPVAFVHEWERLRRKGVNAILSFETGHYLRDEAQRDLFHNLFQSFPKHLLQKVGGDLTPEETYQLVIRLSEWWDTWSVYAQQSEKALDGRKTDQLRRLIELCEVLERLQGNSSVAQSKNSSWKGGTTGLDVDVAADVHAHALRKSTHLLRQLEHPSTEFSLHSRARMQEPPRRLRPLRTNKGVPPPAVSDQDLEAAMDMMPKMPPVPGVATLSPPPKYNERAKKLLYRWETRSKSPQKM